MRRFHRLHHFRCDVVFLGEKAVGYGQRRHRVIEALLRPVAAPDVEHDLASPVTYGDLGAHAVGPEAVDEPVFQRLRSHQTEIDAAAPGIGNWGDRDIVAHRIDAGCDEELLQPEIDPRCRADLASFNDIDIAASAIDVRSHDQEPVHPLRLCAQKLRTPQRGNAASAECAEPATQSTLPSRRSA